MSDIDTAREIEDDDAEENERRSAWVSDLRALLDHLEQHPDLIPGWGHCFARYALDAEEFAGLVRDIGQCSKSASDETGTLSVKRKFGEHELRVFVSRGAVCDRTVVGTRKVMKRDPEAPLVEVEEDIVEWHCPDSFLKLGEDGEQLS